MGDTISERWGQGTPGRIPRRAARSPPEESQGAHRNLWGRGEVDDDPSMEPACPVWTQICPFPVKEMQYVWVQTPRKDGMEVVIPEKQEKSVPAKLWNRSLKVALYLIGKGLGIW